jgi:excisionase family DNA binding protein
VSTRYLTLKQAAEVCATSPETIRFWCHVGKLPAFKPGRQVLVKEADLVALIEASNVADLRVARAKAARKGAA